MGDDVKAKEERFRLRVKNESIGVRALVGDGNPGSLRLSLGDTLLTEGPEITARFLGKGDDLRGQGVMLEGTIRKDRPGAQGASIWLYITVGDAPEKPYSCALDVEDNALVSLAVVLRFL